MSTSCPGLMVTTSDDDILKVWDLIDLKAPQLVWEKKTNLGKILCLDSSPDNPFVFSVGGDNKAHNFKVFDFTQITAGNWLKFFKIANNSFSAILIFLFIFFSNGKI